MARLLLDGKLDAAEKIAAEMLEADLDCPDSLQPPPAPQDPKATGEGDIETMARNWQDAFGPLSHKQRRGMLGQLFGRVPTEHLADVAAAIKSERIARRRVRKGRNNRAYELRKKEADLASLAAAPVLPEEGLLVCPERSIGTEGGASAGIMAAH